MDDYVACMGAEKGIKIWLVNLKGRHLWAFADTVLNLRVPWKEGKFLTS
jgi:hypothetical protein